MRPGNELAGLAGPRRRCRRRGRRLHPDQHDLGPGRRPHQRDDAVPRHRRPPGARGRAAGRQPAQPARARGALGAGRHAAQRRRRRRPGRPRSRTTSRAPSSTPARATRPGRATIETASRPPHPTTSSRAAASRTGSTSTRSAIPQADEQQRLLANLDHPDEPGPDAAAAVLVPAARPQGGRRHDGRRPRRRRRGDDNHFDGFRSRATRRAARWPTGSACGRRRTSYSGSSDPRRRRVTRRAGSRSRCTSTRAASNFTPAIAGRRLERAARRVAHSSYPGIASPGRTGPTASSGATG